MDDVFVRQGWQCPICKRVYSPDTSMCAYCGGEQQTFATTDLTIDFSGEEIDEILRSKCKSAGIDFNEIR